MARPTASECATGLGSNRPQQGGYGKVQQGDIIHATPEINAIQAWLIERGHAGVGGKNGQPDGQFGDVTGKALHDEIERIQKAKGIKPDGKLNKETVAALKEESPEVANAIESLQAQKVGNRPSAMDRIYNAKRYETAPEADDNMCRAPGAEAPKVLPQDPAQSHAQPKVRDHAKSVAKGGSGKPAKHGVQGDLQHFANAEPAKTGADNGMQYFANADKPAQPAADGGLQYFANAGGEAPPRAGTLHTKGLGMLQELGAEAKAPPAPVAESPLASIGNAISSFANRIRGGSGFA